MKYHKIVYTRVSTRMFNDIQKFLGNGTDLTTSEFVREAIKDKLKPIKFDFILDEKKVSEELYN